MLCYPIKCSITRCSFVDNNTFFQESGVWKFNNSLLFHYEFDKKSKIHIKTRKTEPSRKLFLFRSLKMEIFEIKDM